MRCDKRERETMCVSTCLLVRRDERGKGQERGQMPACCFVAVASVAWCEARISVFAICLSFSFPFLFLFAFSPSSNGNSYGRGNKVEAGMKEEEGDERLILQPAKKREGTHMICQQSAHMAEAEAKREGRRGLCTRREMDCDPQRQAQDSSIMQSRQRR